MNRNIFYLQFFVFVFLGACSMVPTQDIKVDAQVDPKARMSGYKSYAWLATASVVNDSLGQWEPPSFDTDAEITYLLDRELRKRGMSENTANPDLLVAYAAGIDMDALGVKQDPKTKQDMLKNIPKGALVVFLIDSETGYIIWVGMATADVNKNHDAKTMKARLDYVVTQMMKKLPK